MTDPEWVAEVLEEEWQEDNEYRDNPVPKPQFAVEGEKNRRARNIAKRDLIQVEDGGVEEFTPRSVGYREEKVETLMDLELITSKGTERIEGDVEEEYGGLDGEVRRIAHKYRLGVTGDESFADPGYDRLVYSSFEDQVEKRGADMYAATVTLIFVTEAEKIKQSPVR